MSAEETWRDLVRALELAWDLECGISWYDVEGTKKELNRLRWKYLVDPYDVEDEDVQKEGEQEERINNE